MGQEHDRPHEEVRILVVDDEPHIIDFIALGLRREGYRISTAADGPEALRKAQTETPQVVILDLMLPGMDGLQVCRRLRAGGDVPILLLTARDAIEDRVLGLDAGADDYLCKPFSFAELSARVRALLRRRGTYLGPILQWAGLRADVTTREVWRGEAPVSLTAREFDLLVMFMRHPRQVLTRQIILDTVWGFDFEGDDNIVEVYVRYLRNKLGDQPPRLLQTVRGVGYALRTPRSSDLDVTAGLGAGVTG